MKKEFKYDFLGREIVVETGELAKQADGAVLVRYGDTVILTAAVMSDTVGTGDFFPLTVVYNEKLYSVGKIPGGFIKREGRPSDAATLAARQIDRPIRPMFDENFRNEVQVINTVLSVDPNNSPEMTALFGSSLALGISKIPFDGPVAGVVVGKIGKEYIINPTADQIDNCELTVTVAGTKDDICMIEAGAKQVSEKEMLEALMFGQKHVKMLCEFQESIIDVVGKEKVEVELAKIDPEFEKEVKSYAEEDMLNAVQIKDKIESYARIDEIKEDTVAHFTEIYPEDENAAKNAKKIVDSIEGEVVRDLITNKKVRPDGRKVDEIRPLSAYIDLLPRTHGSAVFTRGQTQILSVATLAGPGMKQELDGVDPQTEKTYMHKYIFPGFSVGEVKPLRGPGRREVGHGHLAERANVPALPSQEEFGYTIRVTSDVLESNGSTSMGSTCGSSMALMNAGVPVKCMIGGVAMGMIKEEGYEPVVLTDIQGIEDFLGDMDFKVTGNDTGITALQMDMKAKGIPNETLRRALFQAKEGRLHILSKMREAITEPGPLSPFAPSITTMTIPVEDIGTVIGPGGKQIRAIIDASGAEIDIQDTGVVTITSNDQEGAQIATRMIKELTFKPEPGMVVKGKVVRIIPIGAFVELAPGKDGMVHISQVCNERIETIEPHLNVGDEVIVKVIKIDDKGRVNLTIKGVSEEEKAQFN